MESEHYPGMTDEEVDAIRREAMDFSGIGIYRYRFDGTVLFMDRGALRILDLEDRFPDPRQVAGKNISELIVYEGPRGELRSRIRQQRHLRGYRYTFQTLKGERRCALHDSYLTRDRLVGDDVIQVIIRDITPLFQIEESLDAERERLSVTLSSIGDGVISTDVQGRIALLNREAERLTGWTQADADGKTLPEVFRIINEESRKTVSNSVEKVLENGRTVGLANHTLLIARDGEERAIADSGAPIFDRQGGIIGVVLVFRDVEQERRVEEARQRTEKLESLGVLAGGIAHDFNNYLTAILGNISLAKSALQDHSDPREVLQMLGDAEESSLLARGLTDQLLTFARGGAPVKEVIELPKLIERCTNFALSGSSVRPEVSIAPGLWAVEADPGQVSQVLDNIVINAKQAMPDGGVVHVTADNVTLAKDNAADLGPGEYVRLHVEDEGVGISPGHLSRLFDPYFTTKQDGSGLGLATVLSIVRKHGGGIQVESTPGRGSCFTVYLPARPASPTGANEETGTTMTPAGGHILLMDDKEFVLRVCSRVLNYLGYRTTCARDGVEALKLYRKSLEEGAPFDAVILDLTVPGGQGGVETVQQLRALNPGICAIASSGYANNPVIADYEAYGFRAVITKPYTPDVVRKTLARALAAARRDAGAEGR